MAAGSHQTRGSWYPRDCAVCGNRVLARNGFWNYHVSTKTGTALHHDCAAQWFQMQKSLSRWVRAQEVATA